MFHCAADEENVVCKSELRGGRVGFVFGTLDSLVVSFPFMQVVS